ncbi:MAG: ATP-binding cassette domain-containing protein [Cyclobacteriaceae bacterium]|nr:ATP-binding cassette domain-containing protein [Cyclobacteriaceae bacterium]
MKKSPEQIKMEPVIEVRGLKKSFNGEAILNGVDLKLMKGENLVIIGKSGSGKSVLIKCLVRLIEPEEGSMKVLDQDITKLEGRNLNEYRRNVGFLFQGGALYDSMTVRQNLMFPLKRSVKKMNKEEMEERVHEMLKNVKLEDAIDKWPGELSGGMKNRIALARTLVLQPRIIFYDEPTSGLDALTSKEISNLIVEMQENHQVSSVIITHDISCVKITSNRINILKEGTIVDEGTYEEMSNREDPWINAFFK